MDHLDIVKRLCDNNCNTYIVGGGIRDMLLGNNPDDFDVVTEATPNQILQLFKDCKIKEVGKSFGVILIEGYEVATFRHDIHNNGECTIEFAKTIHDDLKRRDLTVNAMAFCELTGELIDDHGGKHDLYNHIIKFVGDPNERIKEDPNRIIRACRFVAKIDGSFDEQTLIALQNHSKYFNEYKISPERLRLEILKAMKIKNASKFFKSLKLIGVLKYIFPTLDKCWKHPHGEHHVEDVFEHNMIAGDSISIKYPLLKLAGYLHDIGKPESYNDGKFIDHQIYGSKSAEIELRHLTFSTKEIQTICGLIESHMFPIKDAKPKTLRKLMSRLNEFNINLDDFFRLRMADRKANIGKKCRTIKEWIVLYKNLRDCHNENIPFSIHNLALSGGEIIKEFNLKPGPIVSKIQRFLLNEVIDKGVDLNKPEILKIHVKQYLEK